MSANEKADRDGPADGFTALQEIDVDNIKPNPENPRLLFPQEELERLAESISNEGILVPVVVYPEGDGNFVLIDGERRYKCALMLGLKSVPAVVTKPKTPRENLVQMFNIHLVREPWRDMPTAWALEKLVKELQEEQGGTTVSDAQLADVTGLSRERISRLRHALELPEEYQKYIHEGQVPLNWFWELKRNVIDPMAKSRSNVFDSYGADRIRDAFVAKRLTGVIRDTVSLRDVRPIINFAQKDAGSGSAPSVLDETLVGLIEDPELGIDEAYEDSVQIMVEADKLERRTKNMRTSFERLLSRVRTDDERAHVTRIGQEFISSLQQLFRR